MYAKRKITPSTSSTKEIVPQEKPSMKSATTIRRLVSKEGLFQVNLEKIGRCEKFRRYLGDCFTTFIDLKWRWTLLIIVSGFFLTWMLFACAYFIFGIVHRDMDEELPPKFVPCISNVYSYVTALLFSVETQHTIGYGFRSVTEECPHVITIVFFQFIFGVGLQCLIAGLFFAKLQRAKKRSETIMFSRMACISRMNGTLYLTVRVGNLRSSLLLGVRAMGMLVKKRTTTCGDEIPLTQHHIDFFTEGRCEYINLLWPSIIYHPIDEKSPLVNANHTELLSGYSELIVVLEGVTDSTSKTFQARTSFLPSEIFFNHRFKSIAPTLHGENNFQISYFDFNMVIPTEMKQNRVLMLRDSSSQTINTGDVVRTGRHDTRYWSSMGDVRLSRNDIFNNVFALDSHDKRNDANISVESVDGINIVIDDVERSSVDSTDNIGRRDSGIFSNCQSDDLLKTIDSTSNHVDHYQNRNNNNIEDKTIDEPSIFRRSAHGSKIFTVHRIADDDSVA